MHRHSAWNIIPGKTQRLRLIWGMQGYDISMCKLMFGNAREMWSYISAYDPTVKIILLERLDILAQAVSIAINRLRVESHPTHTFKKTNPVSVVLDPQLIVALLKGCREGAVMASHLISGSGLPFLHLTYEEITNNSDARCIPEGVVEKICTFLEVPVLPLSTLTRKVHVTPLAELVSNWDEVLEVVR